ncbi:MAG TPA: MarC family protein [Nitrososphaera sp.]|nr:MarC family protein [Nitrososphaera sp.]
MTDFIADLVRSTVALFVVMDPVGSIPVFIALAKDGQG